MNYLKMTVKEFHEVGGDHDWTTMDWNLSTDQDPPNISVDSNGFLITGASTIQFTFNDDQGNADPSYIPIGIYFDEDSADPTQSDPRGLSDFPSCNIGTDASGTRYMQVGISDVNPNLHWEFYIVLQRTSDGKLGVIDPKIRNQP